MNISHDVILTYLVPYLSYFDIDKVLTTLKLSPELITLAKKREHPKRLKKCGSNKCGYKKCSYYIENTLHNEYGPAITYENGDEEWYQNDKLHRIDGPAQLTNNYKRWYRHGILHCSVGPALVTLATEEWYQHGDRHRLDGPAYISKNTEVWYLDGKIHRIDGPARIWKDGSQEWFQNGMLHRIDGPAVIYTTTGEKKWYTYGKQII